MINKLQSPTGGGVQERDHCYDIIRFIATIMVVLHHFYTTAVNAGFKSLPFMALYQKAGGALNIGRIGVVLFCILSGALLIKKYNDNINVKQFYKKRLLRIYIPHCIAYLFVFVYYMIVRPSYFKANWVPTVLASFFGLDYFNEAFRNSGLKSYWLVGEWFTTAILFLYLIFPLLRWLYRRSKVIGTVLITALFIYNLDARIISYSNGWFSLTNCLMCFWIGMLIEPIKKEFKGLETTICVIGCVLLLALNPKNICGYAYLVPFIFGVMLFIILTRCNFKTKFTSYVCKYNFEIYLVHHRVLLLLLPLILPKVTNIYNQILFMIILFWLMCKLSEYLQILTNKVIDRINNVSFPKLKLPKICFKRKSKLE